MPVAYDHSTVLHHLKYFDDLVKINDGVISGALECMSIFISAYNELYELKYEYRPCIDEINRIHHKNTHTRNQFIKALEMIMYKGHSIILKNAARIAELESKNNELRTILSENLEDILLED